jgi:hypothetical protein
MAITYGSGNGHYIRIVVVIMDVLYEHGHTIW